MKVTRGIAIAMLTAILVSMAITPATGATPTGARSGTTGRAAAGQAAAGQASAGQASVDQRTGRGGDGRAETLRALADRSDLRIGTAVDMAALAADPTYREHVAREFSTVTAENVMKWESTEPERGVRDWTAADQLIDFARRNGQTVRGHTLVWHNQNPRWLTEGDFTPAELRTILREHVFAEVRHFRGKVWHWDVVNEVFTDDGQLRDSFWLRELGPGYIADAFRWAHQADPRVRLYLNDYNVEGVNAKSTAYYNLARQLRAQGVPVHGFGIQGHLGVQYGFPPDIPQNLRRFEAIGMETAFTEVDVRMPMPTDPTKLQAQAHGYTGMLQACLLVRRCVSYTVWGFTDKYSWVPGVFAGEGAANLLDENFAPKPAHQAVTTTLLLAAGGTGRGGDR